MKSNYDIVREYLEEHLETWAYIEKKRAAIGEKLTPYGEAVRDTLGIVLSLMNTLEKPKDIIKKEE